MKIDEVKEMVIHANWFALIGSYQAWQGKLSISHLHAWDSEVFDTTIDSEHVHIAKNMDWLPTSRDQDDPIYGAYLIQELKCIEPEARAKVMDVYKMAMRSLRNVHNVRLVSGPNNFTNAAIGAALYCSKMAAIEAVICKQGEWCDLLRFYSDGYWPCGRMPNGDIVVY